MKSSFDTEDHLKHVALLMLAALQVCWGSTNERYGVLFRPENSPSRFASGPRWCDGGCRIWKASLSSECDEKRIAQKCARR